MNPNDKSPELSRAVMERLDGEEMSWLIDEVAKIAKDWTDEEFASRVVGLLIRDKGNLNKYQRTIELSLRIFRAAERLRPCN